MTLIGAILVFVAGRPFLAAALSVGSLADCSNCIRLGHTDWWLPAVAAVAFACLVKQQEPGHERD